MAKRSSPAVIAGKGKGKANAAAPVTSVRLSSSSGGPERTVDVRKIENGFIVRESCYSDKGGYKTSERFSPTAPEIKVDGAGMKAPKGK